MDEVGTAANGTVLDVLLTLAGGEVDGNYDLFAAGVADIGSFFLHG
jgi:hypothetical protein